MNRVIYLVWPGCYVGKSHVTESKTKSVILVYHVETVDIGRTVHKYLLRARDTVEYSSKWDTM